MDTEQNIWCTNKDHEKRLNQGVKGVHAVQYLSSVVVSVKIVPNLGGWRGGQVIIPEVNDTGQF